MPLLFRHHLLHGVTHIHEACTGTSSQSPRCHLRLNPHMGVILWRIALLLKPLRGSPQSVPELHGKMMVSMNGNPNPRTGAKDRKHRKHVFGQSFVYPSFTLTNEFKLLSSNGAMYVNCSSVSYVTPHGSYVRNTRARLYLTRGIIQLRLAYVLPLAWARATPGEGWRSCLL